MTLFFSCADAPSLYSLISQVVSGPYDYFSPFFLMYIAFLSGVVVHLSSHNTPNDNNGAVWIFGKIWICLISVFRPGIWSVDICVYSIVLPYGSLVFILISIIIGAIVGVSCIARCIFAPESAISSMLVLVELSGELIWFIKIVLGLLILILLFIALYRHSHPFSLSSLCPAFFAEQVLLPWVKLLPQLHQYTFLFGIAWLVCAMASVFSSACMAFMLTVICSKCAINTKFKLVRAVLACDSPSTS